CARQDSNIDYW
nr:immunoglobulin heavy chain junction region [Macaca mulatta]